MGNKEIGFLFKRTIVGPVWWYTPVIPDTQEVKVRASRSKVGPQGKV
jgi:hypothetical protein